MVDDNLQFVRTLWVHVRSDIPYPTVASMVAVMQFIVKGFPFPSCIEQDMEQRRDISEYLVFSFID